MPTESGFSLPQTHLVCASLGVVPCEVEVTECVLVRAVSGGRRDGALHSCCLCTFPWDAS